MATQPVTAGELTSLQTVALASGQQDLFDQAASEAFYANGQPVHPANWLVQQAVRQRTYLFRCPCCRRYRNTFSAAERQRLAKRGYCHDCQRTDFARLRYHVAFIADAITAPTPTHGWQDRIRRKALTLPESQRAVYRQLFRKRQAQYAAAYALLDAALAHMEDAHAH